MNPKILKFISIVVLGIITFFSLSACTKHKVSEQSTQDILMSKTWDEADNKGTVNWQVKFNKSQVEIAEGVDKTVEDYKITREHNKEYMVVLQSFPDFNFTV